MMVRPGVTRLCVLAVFVLALGCSQAAQSQSGTLPLSSPWLSHPSEAVEAAARFENELSEAEWQQVLRLASGLSAAEASEINTIAAELYAAEQQERTFPPSVQASMACQDAEERMNLPGEAVLVFHRVRDSLPPPSGASLAPDDPLVQAIRRMRQVKAPAIYPTPGESRALLAMRLNCSGDAMMRNYVTALAQHQMTWSEFQQQSRQQIAEFERERRESMAKIDAEIARMKREGAQGTAPWQQAQRAAAQQQAAAQQAQQCRQLAAIMMLQTTPIDAAEAQQIQRCPQLAQYVMFRNMIRDTNDALRATEPSAPQSWHCERSVFGGVNCDSQ